MMPTKKRLRAFPPSRLGAPIEGLSRRLRAKGRDMRSRASGGYARCESRFNSPERATRLRAGHAAQRTLRVSVACGAPLDLPLKPARSRDAVRHQAQRCAPRRRRAAVDHPPRWAGRASASCHAPAARLPSPPWRDIRPAARARRGVSQQNFERRPSRPPDTRSEPKLDQRPCRSNAISSEPSRDSRAARHLICNEKTVGSTPTPGTNH
jgi:hypothetical protein